MKYSETNKPLVCMQTQSTCYKGTKKMTVRGVLVHSTGANNPNVCRYVQPSDDAPDKDKMLALLGKNKYGNDWNHIYHMAGLNGWLGKLADGTVAFVQSMPFDYKPWGCGSGPRGSCNDGWIQFEICEDGLTDKTYFDKIYKEATEIVAYLCKMYGLDPNGTVTYNGVKVPVILDHVTSHNLGLGSGHADVGHWFPKHGKTLETFRKDVATAMGVTTQPVQTTTTTGTSAGIQYPAGAMKFSEIWDFFINAGFTEVGVAGLMGNLYAESALCANNLQNNGNKKLGVSDEEFTQMMDSGKYTNFVRDGYGYGLAQWTYWSRKQALLEYAKSKKVSIGDAKMQCEFILKELAGYPAVLQALKGGAKTIREASDSVLLNYERPANQSEDVQKKRAKYGQEQYNKYAKGASAETATTTTTTKTNYLVRVTISDLYIRKGPGVGYGKNGFIPKGTYTIVEESDGPGATKWGKLKSGAGWISLDYAKKV